MLLSWKESFVPLLQGTLPSVLLVPLSNPAESDLYVAYTAAVPSSYSWGLLIHDSCQFNGKSGCTQVTMSDNEFGGRYITASFMRQLPPTLWHLRRTETWYVGFFDLTLPSTLWCNYPGWILITKVIVAITTNMTYFWIWRLTSQLHSKYYLGVQGGMITPHYNPMLVLTILTILSHGG